MKDIHKIISDDEFLNSTMGVDTASNLDRSINTHEWQLSGKFDFPYTGEYQRRRRGFPESRTTYELEQIIRELEKSLTNLRSIESDLRYELEEMRNEMRVYRADMIDMMATETQNKIKMYKLIRELTNNG